MNSRLLIDKMKQYEIDEINEKYKYFNEQKLKIILNFIKDEELLEYVKNNVYFLIELMEDNIYLDSDIVNLFIFINSSTEFKNGIDIIQAQEISERINEEGYYVYERYIFFTDKKYIIDLFGESEIEEVMPAFNLENNKKLYYVYVCS